MAIPQSEQFPNGSVIQLESPLEESYSYILTDMIEVAKNDPDMRPEIQELWDGEKWESIVRKFHTEGSTWYVWWMDGVRRLIERDRVDAQA